MARTLPGGISDRAALMALGRAGLFAGCALAPGLVIKALGFPEDTGTARTFATMLGVRDLAVAATILATAADRRSHRRALLIAGLVDVGDVLAIGLAARRDPAMRKAALANLPFAGGSAVYSFLAVRAA